jgi:Undecaprenyl-phosphate galactose phosphotransferase WbaP
MMPSLNPNRRRIRQFTPSVQTTPTVLLPDSALGRRMHRLARTGLLVSVDVSMIATSVVIAYLSWAAPVRDQSAALYLGLLPFVVLFPLGYGRAGLYPGLGLGPVEMLRRLSYVTAFGFLVLAAFSFGFRLPPTYSRVTFGLALVLSLILVPTGRLVLTHVARRFVWWAEPVVIIGAGPSAARAVRGIRQARHLGYEAAAVIRLEATAATVSSLEGVPVVGGLEQASALSARGIHIAFLDVEQLPPREVLDRLQQEFLHVILLRELDDLPIESLQVRNLGSMIGIEYTNNLLRRRNQIAKRALDVIIGSLALLVLSPIIFLAALAVLLIDGAPVFFHQSRAGLGGHRIRVPKIRTMRRDADKELEEHLAANSSLRDEWRTRYKLRDDPRLIAGIGKLFRRFSIDELPQLWTVLTGGMSMVGPRPFPDYHLEQFTPEFRELRQRVRPGITGLWQITMRSEGSTDDQEALDSYYLRNWSVWFDLYVLARTILAVASGRGAY